VLVAVLATIIMILVVKLRSQFSSQFVALALISVIYFSQFLALFIQGWTQLETSFSAVARVQEFCGATENENLPTEASPAPEHWPSRGHIALENLTASYALGAEPVLHGVTLDILAGAKSSLMACLLRMLEISPDSHIRFDGVDVATLPRQAVRVAVAVIPQHPFFLRMANIRDNLVPRRGERQQQQQQHSDDKILSVLSRLKMRDAVERMGGLDSPLDFDWLSQG